MWDCGGQRGADGRRQECLRATSLEKQQGGSRSGIMMTQEGEGGGGGQKRYEGFERTWKVRMKPSEKSLKLTTSFQC